MQTRLTTIISIVITLIPIIIPIVIPVLIPIIIPVEIPILIPIITPTTTTIMMVIMLMMIITIMIIIVIVQEPQRIIVLWTEGSIEDLTDSLTRFTPRGSEVTVISKEEPEVCLSLQPARKLRPALDRGRPGVDV